ncbi:MAG: ATP-binding protein [Geobacteraceae bacterium]|nr:ATP-binding protein [Geobacteraceae bacterium]
MHPETVDLGEMAREIVAGLMLARPQRRVKFNAAEGVVAKADAKLLRVVMENLLGNAWKYTGKKEEALIEFGIAEPNGKTAYFVRDNGAGFDMIHAERLFAAFQRLHANKEFAGIGIGLCTVRRIIQRHGGQVWAEGNVGAGATFYFTLA